MSLVLDALQRQARDEQPGGTDLTQEAAARRSNLAPWLGFLAVALLVNAGVLLWVGLLDDERDEAAQPAAETAPATHPATTPVTATGPLTAEQPPAAAASDAAAQSVISAPAAAATPAMPPSAPMPGSQQADAGAGSTDVRTIERVALTELPPAARARLPGIVISSHVYGEDPESRTIIANGVTLREGSVLAGLPLKEIGPDGIVVEFESWLVEIPVFADW